MLQSDNEEIIIPINFDHDVWKDKRRKKFQDERRAQLARRNKSNRRVKNDQDMEDSENE